MDPKCRLCGHFDKTIDHLVSGCPELAKTKYIHRHNKAAAHMHWKICKEFGIEVKEWWYEHEPRAVTKNDTRKSHYSVGHAHPLWQDQSGFRPDIVLKNKKDKTCLLIDMTIPLDTNTSVKTTEKLYQIQRPGNRGWANVGAQNNNSYGYRNPWHHQEGHGKQNTPKKSLATSTYVNSRK